MKAHLVTNKMEAREYFKQIARDIFKDWIK